MSSIARIQKDISNIQVFIRIKPFSLNQPQDQCCIDKINQRQITLLQKQNGQAPSFIFDGIFNIDSTQEQVYQQVKQNIIDNAFQGINGTIFHYGQTTAGKTYTCVGKDLRDTKQRGILPRIINQILQRSQTKPKNVQSKITFSTIEIYNQKIKDLLDPTKNDMKIRQYKNRGIFLQGLTEKYIHSLQDANFYISKAIENKYIWHTHMGTAFSRSHVLYMITLHQHDVYTGEARAAKITIVDLAGSQKISKTDGKFINQTKKISTSLCTLGKIINILGQGKKNVHIPYRDSKLTRLLQQSLGGNSVTKLIINISPAMVNQSQTLCSLRFGSWAKIIKNKPRINKQFTVPELLELLSKYEKKLKILADVIKQMMKEKGKPHLSLKQIIKMYLPNLGISDQTYKNQQQYMTRSILNSVSSRRMQAKRQSQQNNNINTHTKSFSGQFKFNRRDNLINFKSRQKIVPAIQKINQLRPNLVPKPTKQSLIFQRSSDVLNSFFQPKVEISQLQLRKPYKGNKTEIKINPQMFNNNQSDNQSQTIQPKSGFLQPDQSHQISNLNYLQNQFYKNHLLHLNSPQVKSMLGPICALHSKVLETSISGLNYTSQVNNRQNSSNRDSKIESQCEINDKQNMSLFQPNSIQFNIEKIRYNLRKLNKIRKSQIN